MKFELILILDGSVEINIEGQKYTVNQYAAIMIEPLRYHVVTGCNTVYHRMILEFSKEIIPEPIYQSLIASLAVSPIHFSMESKYILQRMAAIANSGAEAYYPLFNSFIVQLFYLFLNGPDLKDPDISSKNTGNVKKIIKYVDEHIHRTITLQMLADELFMSVSSICHIFKQEMKITVKQYILRKKIYYAADLMMSGSPATVAAAQCGYENYAAFHKAFTRIMHTAPSRLTELPEQKA